NRCWRATATSSPRSTRIAWPNAATVPAPGDGGLHIARPLSRREGRTIMTWFVARIRFVLAAIAVVMIAGLAMPAGAQQVNPTADAVNEQRLLQEMTQIQGRGSIPDTKSYIIEQPRGREWRQFHEVTL